MHHLHLLALHFHYRHYHSVAACIRQPHLEYFPSLSPALAPCVLSLPAAVVTLSDVLAATVALVAIRAAVEAGTLVALAVSAVVTQSDAQVLTVAVMAI